MGSESAIILFAHGARDVLWAQPVERLRAAMAAARPELRIAVAYLELQTPNLLDTLGALAAEGVSAIDIAPIFWSRGGHIARDLPALVAAFTAATPGVRVQVLPVLAELPGMEAFVARAILAKAGGAPLPETRT